MNYWNVLRGKMEEAAVSVLPITAIVFLLSISIAPLSPGALVLFLFGAFLLVFGMGLFTVGVDMSMIPMGEGIGAQMSKAKHAVIPLCICFVLGAVITMAEPDLSVLANQIPAIPNMILILTVSVGVGIFLVVAEARMLLQIPLSYTLLFFYALILIIAIVTPENFLPVSFDAGGVTTGPITVPFIMALGIGMASVRSDKNSSSDSFGLISLCSIGPILSVLLLGVFYQPEDASYTPVEFSEIATTRDAAAEFAKALPAYFKEVAISLTPIVLLFFLFQIAFRRFHRRQIGKILLGMGYAYLGLVLFLTGVNVGFMPAGELIGSSLASGGQKWMLVPIGVIIGFFIVRAEPAVHVLTKQVEEISNGSISQQAILISLSVGVAASVGLAMLRILTGLSIAWFLVPGYVLSLVISFFVPHIYTGIAFDSGGVASGPMTATFLLPLAMGACEALGGNILTDAFGIVAMVAMTPLLTIQILGLRVRWQEHAEKKRSRSRAGNAVPDSAAVDEMIYFDE